MKGWSAAAAALLVACGLTVGRPASPRKSLEPLNQYVVEGDVESLAARVRPDRGRSGQGRPGHRGHARAGRRSCARRASRSRRRTGRPRPQAAPPDPFATNPTYGYDVFRPWHLQPAPCPGTCSGAVDSAGKPINLQTWYENQRAAHPDIVKKVVYGKSRFGQDLVAYKVSLNAHTLADGAKPVVWYETTQHAREWLATEAGRRLFGYVLAHATDTATDIPTLLHDTEMWFVPVVNVDGYDWTFQRKNTRLWRSNLRDNDGDDVLDRQRRRRHQPQLGGEVALRPGGRVGRLRQRHLPRPVGAVRARGQLARRDVRQAQAEVPARLPLLRAADPLPGGLAGRDRRAPTRRRRRRSRAATTTTRRSRTSTRTSPASSTRPTATSPATPTTATARSAYTVELDRRQRPGRRRHGRRPELVPARRLRLPGLRGRRARPSSSATCSSRSTSRARPRTRAARCRTSATSRRTSCRPRSSSPTATRRLVEVNANRDLGPVEVALARQRRRRAVRAPRASTRAASATTRPASTTTRCGPTSPGFKQGD